MNSTGVCWRERPKPGAQALGQPVSKLPQADRLLLMFVT